MNILFTSSRMPAALDEIRKFGELGHRVFAGDTLRTAPGSYSRYVEERFRFAPPEREPYRFIEQVTDFVVSHEVDLVVPCSEEVFYLAQYGASLAQATHVFVAPIETLARLHNKASFHELAKELGASVPATRVVHDGASLARAIEEHELYVARPVWSRGATDILSNAPSFPHSLRVEDCAPTDAHPWIVQEYVDGVDVCSFSVAREGRVAAHAAYVHPRTFDGGGGIVFESIDEPRSLEVARRVVDATSFHGQISFDFRWAGGRLYALECNPRPTAGVQLLSAEALVTAMVGAVRAWPLVARPGVRSVYAGALLRDIVLRHEGVKESLAYLRENDDFFFSKHDRLPGFVQLLSYSHVIAHRLRHRGEYRPGTSMIAAFFDGVTWDGEAKAPAPGASPSDGRTPTSSGSRSARASARHSPSTPDSRASSARRLRTSRARLRFRPRSSRT